MYINPAYVVGQANTQQVSFLKDPRFFKFLGATGISIVLAALLSRGIFGKSNPLQLVGVLGAGLLAFSVVFAANSFGEWISSAVSPKIGQNNE